MPAGCAAGEPALARGQGLLGGVAVPAERLWLAPALETGQMTRTPGAEAAREESERATSGPRKEPAGK